MTCIVGFIEKNSNRVIVGGDSAGSDYHSLSLRKDPKVFRVKDFVIGATSSYRMIQILRFNFVPPPLKGTGIGFQETSSEIDLYQYMCTEFINALRKTLKDAGFLTITNGSESGGTFLVAYKDRLFCIHDDLQVAEFFDGYHSVGSGSNFALGAIAALTALPEPPPAEDIVRIALEAAEKFSTTVQGPFVVETT